MWGWRFGAKRDHEGGAAGERARKRKEARGPIIARGERFRFATALHIGLSALFNEQVADDKNDRHAKAPSRDADHPGLQVKPERSKHQPGQDREACKRLAAIAQGFPQTAAALAQLIEEVREKSSHSIGG